MKDSIRHIALMCPGGPISHALAEKVNKIAASMPGEPLRLHFHDQCFETHGHFAGTDDRRGAAFLEIANASEFDAIWFARGGYGACRLSDDIFPQLNEHARRKTYLGYSDAGVLLARLYKLGIGRPAHGPMPTDLDRDEGDKAVRRALNFLAAENRGEIESGIKPGSKTAAFNITVLSHFIAADWAPSFEGHVIMLEDVSEYLYRIDRAFFTIMSHPRMREVAGVRLGRVSDVLENDRPFGQSVEEIAQYWCARAGVEFLGQADIGHDADNKIVPFGEYSTS